MVKVVNRGFIIVKAKQPFFDWANQFDLEIFFDEEDDNEPSIYLIEEDFVDDELIIEQNFKKIFRMELEAITEEEEEWPKISLATFNDWFTCELGSMVFDLLDQPIISED